MPAFCCGELLQHHFNTPSWSWRHWRGLHGQRSGQMFHMAPVSTHSGHRPTPRERRRFRKCTAWVRGETVGAHRGVRLKESATVDGGCIVKTRACFVLSNFSDLYWREAVELCWDMTAKLPFISTTSCMQSICNMEQFGTKYQNVPIFIIISEVFIILSQFYFYWIFRK